MKTHAYEATTCIKLAKAASASRPARTSQMLRNVVFRAAAFFLMLLGTVTARALEVDETPSLGAVIDQLAKRDKIITTYTCDESVRIRQRSRLTGQYWDFAIATKVQSERPLHRFHIGSSGQTIAPPAKFKKNKEYLTYFEEQVGCDGSTTRTYYKTTGYDPNTGEDSGRPLESANVTKGANPRFVVNPEDLFGRYGNRSIGETLEEGPTATKGFKDGILTLECSYPLDRAANAFYRLTFELDVRKAMAPVRIEDSTRFDGAKEWLPTHELRLAGYTEAEPGLWLPGSFDETLTSVARDETSTLLVRRSGSVSFSSLNAKLPDHFHRVNFPPGVHVTDGVRGNTYKSQEITDTTIARDATEATAIRETYLAERDELTTKLAKNADARAYAPWAAVVVFLLGSLGACYYVLRRGRKA